MKGAKRVSEPSEFAIAEEPSRVRVQNLEISFSELPGEASIPEQKEHFQLPTRFGAVPVDEAPLG
ncbi:MAG: hypothetical protein QMD04_13290 [Anaerolineales bacterium]|nr:hypothetical protein [Anaerolineales bacterium]